jgi:hypothetical protein
MLKQIAALQLSMAATAGSKWIDLRSSTHATLQVSCGAVNTPAGAVTVEYSNDNVQCEREIVQYGANATPDTDTTTTAVRIGVTTALSVVGTAPATGFDGGGNRSFFTNLAAIGLPGFVRVVYTRASGGAADVLLINVISRA